MAIMMLPAISIQSVASFRSGKKRERAPHIKKINEGGALCSLSLSLDLKDVGQELHVAHVHLAEGEDLVGEEHKVCEERDGGRRGDTKEIERRLKTILP